MHSAVAFCSDVVANGVTGKALSATRLVFRTGYIAAHSGFAYSQTQNNQHCVVIDVQRKWVPNKSVSRRGFLKTGAVLSGVMVSANPVLSGCSGGLVSPYKNLTRQQGALLEILADRIIPPDTRNPGGNAAGVPRFIDRQLGQHLRSSQPMYERCLSALNDACHARYKGLFMQLRAIDQSAYLTDIEAGLYDEGPERHLWDEYTPSAFFSVLVDHCMMGFYGDPKHGGNNDYASYKMLGLFVEQVPMRPPST